MATTYFYKARDFNFTNKGKVGVVIGRDFLDQTIENFYKSKMQVLLGSSIQTSLKDAVSRLEANEWGKEFMDAQKNAINYDRYTVSELVRGINVKSLVQEFDSITLVLSVLVSDDTREVQVIL